MVAWRFVKRICLPVALLLFVGSFAVLGASASSSPELYSYSRVQDGVCVTAYLGTGHRIVAVPKELGGQAVVAIGAGAFWGNSEVVVVTLPKTVTRLESNAFTGCAELTELSGGGITYIGDYALYGCDKLTSLTVGGMFDTVGEQVLGSALPTVSVPETGGVGGLLRAYAVLNGAQPGVAMGGVGQTRLTSDMLALYDRLGYYLSIPEDDIEALWAREPSENFPQYYEKLHVVGLYKLLDGQERSGVDLRMDALIDALAADAERLEATLKRNGHRYG